MIAYVQTLHVFISGSGSALGAYVAEALNMVRPSLEDPFHGVNIKACKCVELLAHQLGKRLQPVCKELTAQVMALLTHRRKAVRCAAIGAVRRLMFCGAHEMLLEMVAWRDPNSVAIKAFYEPETKVPSHCLHTRNRRAIIHQFIQQFRIVPSVFKVCPSNAMRVPIIGTGCVCMRRSCELWQRKGMGSFHRSSSQNRQRLLQTGLLSPCEYRTGTND